MILKAMLVMIDITASCPDASIEIFALILAAGHVR